MSKDFLAGGEVRKHRREDCFNSIIEEACYKAGAVQPVAIKAIIQTLNPEWKSAYQDHRTQRYGITGIQLHHARSIVRGIDYTELFYPERCIQITAHVIRLFVNLYSGYGLDGRGGAMQAYGLRVHDGQYDPLNVKPAWIQFCNKTGQPQNYLPAEVPGVMVR